MHKTHQKKPNLRGVIPGVTDSSEIQESEQERYERESLLQKNFESKGEEVTSTFDAVRNLNSMTDRAAKFLSRASFDFTSASHNRRLKVLEDKTATIAAAAAVEHKEEETEAAVKDRRSLLRVPISFDFFRFNSKKWNIAKEIQGLRESELVLTLIFVLSGAISFAVGILLTLHTYLIFSAQTTIEFFLSWPLRTKFK